MNNNFLRYIAGVACLLCGSLNLQAQSYFLVPSSFFSQKGDKIQFNVYNGKSFDTTSAKRIPVTELKEASLYTNSKPVNLLSEDKTVAKSAIDLSLQDAGICMVTASRELIIDNLDREDVMRQLADEGFQKLVDKADEKEEMGIRNLMITKSLVVASKPSGGVYGDRVNQPLELVPQQNPYKMKYGEDMTLQVLFKGKPLTDSRVQVMVRTINGSVIPSDYTTDGDGKIYLKLNRSGEWMLKVLCIEPIANAPEKGPDYDRWCSVLTFGFRG